MTDPVEKLVAEALEKAGIQFITPDQNHPLSVGLDFYIQQYDLHIECKRFHTYRISEQMSRASCDSCCPDRQCLFHAGVGEAGYGGLLPRLPPSHLAPNIRVDGQAKRRR